MDTENVAAEAAPETPAASPATQAEATLTPRQIETLQGQSRALEAKTKEAERLAQELATAQRTIAERQQADMTEFEKAQLRIKTLENEVAEARVGLTRAQLAAKYPKATEFFGDDALPSETRLADLEKTLTTKPETKVEPETAPPPNPPKQHAPTENRSQKDILMDQVRDEARKMFGGG